MRVLHDRLRGLAACLLLLPLGGCGLFKTAVNIPGKLATDITGGGKKEPEQVPLSVLQTGVMRFADTFTSRITQATQEFAAKSGTPDARIQALSWLTNQSTSAYTIATGPNPRVAVLDMIVLVSLGRMVHEEYWLPKVYGEADRPMLEAFTQLETTVWEVAGQVLAPEQQEAVRTALREWRDQHPDMGVTAFVKLPVFQDLIKGHGEAAAKDQNLGDLLVGDPLAGLEPAVREIEQARLLAERSVFYVQRAPILLATQVELLGLKLARFPEMQRALDDTQRVSKAAESLAATAAALPEAVRVEREAAVKQVADALSAQRQGLLQDLAAAEGPSGKLLGEARQTLEAGTRMSAALEATIATLNTFVGRFDKPAPAGAPPGKPFDVAEYGAAMEKLGTAAHELNGMLLSLDQGLPKVQAALDEATQRGQQTIDHAFTRGLELGLALIGVAALAAFLVLRFARRGVR